MANITEKHAMALTATAIKSSHDNGKALLAAFAADVILAAQVGRCEPLAKLVNEVKFSDAEAIRQGRINVGKIFGSYVTDDGKERYTDFLNYDKDSKTFSVVKKEATGVKAEAMKACRDAVSKLTEKEFVEKISLEPATDNRADRQANAFNFEASLQKLLIRGAKEGVPIPRLMEYGKLIEHKEYKVTEQTLKEAAGNRTSNAEKAFSKLTEAEKQEFIASLKEKETPVSTSEETAQAA